MSTIEQEIIDENNKTFWNELCGSQLAKHLGIIDLSKESLGKFDKYYLDYYPYLEKYLCLDELKDKNVLEVGLGYGTVSQMLALSGANYHGLDIAANAVEMAKHRLKQHHIEGDVRVGSMLSCPFSDNYFDFVVSIGCFHHTGDLQACIDQSYRILKPGGKAIVMVYNKFSLRQWNSWPKLTAKNLFNQYTGAISLASTENQRKAYDASSDDKAAPETDFFSKKDIRKIFRNYSAVNINRENFDENASMTLWKFPSYHFDNRLNCLSSRWAKYFGLDLYIIAIK